MKKNIIIAAIAAASALLLSVSCQKENQPESQNGINAGANTFTATIEQSLTKTTLTDGVKVNWTTGDKININGVTFKATADGTDATKATFAKDPETQNDPTGTLFKAIFPESLCNEDAQGEPCFILPDIQTYSSSSGGFNAPMYAESTTQSLTFKNICAVLAIKVTSEDIATLKSIKVKADKKLHGTFTVASTIAGYKATIGTDGTEEIVLSSSDAISLTSEGTTFYIAIPEQEYSYLKIYLSEDGTLYKRAMITKKATGLGTIACNKIYNINYETNAVQVYANGPYWSTMNIGATTETGFGHYFAWGYAEGCVRNTSADGWVLALDNTTAKQFNAAGFPERNASSFQDAATANWGGSWRMPTVAELNALGNGTWVNSPVKGRRFGTSPNTIFLPAAGSGSDGTGFYEADEWGYYWSSSCRPGDDFIPFFNAYYLKFYDGEAVTSMCSGYFGYSVRPVSD